MSPHPHIAFNKIADGAIGAATAGATIVRLHARRSTWQVAPEPDLFTQSLLLELKGAPNVGF
ncbi:MAG: hypothetical protein ABJA98_21205 [Acidobacteriota bacterium]